MLLDIVYCFKGQLDIDFKESQQIVHASTKIAVDFEEKMYSCVLNFIKLFKFQKYPNVKQKTEINMNNIHKFRMSK
jgi:hypothetical protein